MKNERLTVKNGRLVNKYYYYEPIFISKGIFAIIFPSQDNNNDIVSYYSFRYKKSLPVKLGYDMEIYYKPIFITDNKISIILPYRTDDDTDCVVYYEEEMKVSLPESFTYFDPKNFYYAFEEKKERDEEAYEAYLKFKEDLPF